MKTQYLDAIMSSISVSKRGDEKAGSEQIIVGKKTPCQRIVPIAHMG